MPRLWCIATVSGYSNQSVNYPHSNNHIEHSSNYTDQEAAVLHQNRSSRLHLGPQFAVVFALLVDSDCSGEKKACVRFNSKADVSLHRNHPLSAAAVLPNYLHQYPAALSQCHYLHSQSAHAASAIQLISFTKIILKMPAGLRNDY